MKEIKETTHERTYKLVKKSCFFYTLTAILTPVVAVPLAISARSGEELKDLILLVVLTEVYTIIRAIFDHEEAKNMEKISSASPPAELEQTL
jgi:hypothetical protein